MKSDKTRKILSIILVVLLTLNLALTCYYSFWEKKVTSTKYVLYIGTNDKDTYQMEIPYEECVETVREICAKHTGGGTLAEATGFWQDDTGTITTERTIQCILEDTDFDTVQAIADEIIDALNQSSILIETESVTSQYYSK